MANMHPIQNNTYYNTQKTTDRFGHLLRPLAWKWNGPIFKEVDK